MPAITRLEDWNTWITVCALDLCPGDTRQSLQRFVITRFVTLVRKYAALSRTDPGNAAASTPADAWHLFESHLHLQHTREGKSYKQWLNEHRWLNPENPLPCLESGASLIVRDVVREHLRREARRTCTQPLDTPLRSACSQTYTLSELLPSPETTPDTIHNNEMTRLASDAARQVFRQLTRRERLALLARSLNLPLSSPTVTKAAACRKTTLCAAYRDSLKTIAAFIQEQFASEDRTIRAQLAVTTFSELHPLLVHWGKSEKQQLAFFMEENHDDELAIR
jgi:hypothetical protein